MAEDSTASSTHSGDLSLSYSSSSFESGSSQSSEDIGRHSVEPYLFEPESSDSSLSEGEAVVLEMILDFMIQIGKQYRALSIHICDYISWLSSLAS